MTIDINILLQVILANNEAELVTKAMQLQLNSVNGTIDMSPLFTKVVHRVYKEHLPEGKAFVKENYGYIKSDVISYNPFKLKEQYLVSYPSGKQEWVDNVETTPTPLVDVMVAATASPNEL